MSSSDDTPETPRIIDTTTTTKPLAWSTVKPLLTALMSRAQKGGLGYPVILPPEVPSVAPMMPQQGWWESLSPEIKAGIWEPITEGANNLFEQFGSKGMAGSARGGASGAFGAGLGDYQQSMLPQAAMTGWNMMAPALQQGWSAENSRNIAGWQSAMQSMQYPYSILPGLIGGGGTTVSQVPYWPPQGGGGGGQFSNAAMGALGGAGTGAMIGSVVPGIGTLIGALGGALVGGVGGYLR